jgi:putative spermidine/putrescine transport system ATP-binding protein
VDDAYDIRLIDLAKHYGAVRAVDGVGLEIARGEFFTLLGPSGSGKTTTLRLIAGFELPDNGRVELAGADVTRAPAYARDVNTVFQDYALFPHMTVAENVEYGLRIKRVPKRERRARANDALEMVRLPDVGGRKPAQLSGGQRQRVALARAIVNRPRVLLLDEPLGALDLKLREQMQVELKQIQRDLGITFIFVTHDQEEALTLSDRIAEFNAGRIEQLGTPRELYEQPASRFVADFVGTSNLFDPDRSSRLIGRTGAHTFRPEKLTLSVEPPAGEGVLSAPGTVVESIYVGSAIRHVVDLDAGGRVTVLERNDRSRAADQDRGDRVHVSWHDEDVVALIPPGT